MTVNESKDIAKALNEFQSSYNQASGVDLCTMYKRIQPPLNNLIPLLPVLPHGSDIQIMVKSLKQLLDGFCG